MSAMEIFDLERFVTSGVAAQQAVDRQLAWRTAENDRALEHGGELIAAAEIAVATSDQKVRREKMATALLHAIHFCDATDLDFEALLEWAQALHLAEVDPHAFDSIEDLLAVREAI